MLKNYLKIAWRSLSKHKGFTFIHLSGLGVAFTSCILIYLFVSHHLNFDTFHQNTDRIYRIVTEEHQDDIYYSTGVPPGFANAIRKDFNFQEKIAKIAFWENQLISLNTENNQRKFKVDVVFCEPEFFEIFNFPLVHGQLVKSPGEPNTAVVTERFAQKWFGNKNAINNTFLLENKEVIMITGILKNPPATTAFDQDVFVSFSTVKSYSSFQSGESWVGIDNGLHTYALLKSDQDIPQLEELTSSYAREFREDSNDIHHYKFQPINEVHFNPLYRGAIDIKLLWIFSVIGVLLLVVACINFINISTVQSSYRNKEIGVRKVLGSVRIQILKQFLMEVSIICLIAFVIGLIISWAALPYLNSLFDIRLSFKKLLEPAFIGFISTILFAVTIISGIYPGVLMSRAQPIRILKSGSGPKRSRGISLRQALVVIQFAIAMTMIVGVLVIHKQLHFTLNTDLGFDKQAIVIIQIPPQTNAAKVKDLKLRIKEIPGIEEVTACWALPGAAENSWETDFAYDHKVEDRNFPVEAKLGDHDYLKTFKISLAAGRNFFELETDGVLVNETFTKRLGLTSPDEAIGKSIDINDGFIKGRIIGVTSDFHDQTFHEDISPIFIAPFERAYDELAIKTSISNLTRVLTPVESKWSEAFPNDIFEFHFFDEIVAKQYAAEQQSLSLVKIFSILTLFLGFLGVYGLIAYLVTKKTREIGIRKVLGASMYSITTHLSKEFIVLILVAIFIAIPFSWYIMQQWLNDFAYKVSIEADTFLIAAFIILSTTILSIGYQTVKAALTDPAKSLRSE